MIARLVYSRHSRKRLTRWRMADDHSWQPQGQQEGSNHRALRSNRHTKAIGQFVMHGLAMINSPAWQVLSLSARRVLDRIDIEHMRHGGAEDRCLPITYGDFVHYGIHRQQSCPRQDKVRKA